jgi:hypothetical protein
MTTGPLKFGMQLSSSGANLAPRASATATVLSYSEEDDPWVGRKEVLLTTIL